MCNKPCEYEQDKFFNFECFDDEGNIYKIDVCVKEIEHLEERPETHYLVAFNNNKYYSILKKEIVKFLNGSIGKMDLYIG